MAIRIDFGPELGAVDFPDDMSEEQVTAYVRDNHKEIRQRLIARRGEDAALDTEAEELGRYSRGEMPTDEFVGSAVAQFGRDAMRIAGRSIQGGVRVLSEMGGAMVDPPRNAPAGPIEKSPIYEAGSAVVEKAEEQPVLPGAESSITGQVAGGVGSVAALAPAALTGPAAPFVSGAMYGASAGEEAYQEAIQTMDRRIAAALASGDTTLAADLEREKFEMADAAFALTAPIGAVTEGFLGVAGKLRATKKGLELAFKGNKAREIAAGFVAKHGQLPQWAARRLEGAAKGLATEAAQESSEQVLGNAAAAVTYDPERKLSEGAVQSGLIGGLTGAAVGGTFGAQKNPPDAMPATRAAVAATTPPGSQAAEVDEETSAPLTEADLADVNFPEAAKPAPPAPAPEPPPEGSSVAEVEEIQVEPPAAAPAVEEMAVEVEPPAPPAPSPAAEAEVVSEEQPAPAPVVEEPAAVEPPVPAEATVEPEVAPEEAAIVEPPAPAGKTNPVFIGKGDVVFSKSGRQLTPVPDLSSQTDRKATASIKRLHQWLRDNAIEEAKATGNRIAELSLQQEKSFPMPPASATMANEILFGSDEGPTEDMVRRPAAPPATSPRPAPAAAAEAAKESAVTLEAPIDEPEKKAAEERAEADLVQKTGDSIRAGIVSAQPDRSGRIFSSLVDLYNKAPKNRTRTSTSKINQAYSTPPPLAFLAQKLGQVFSGKVIAESSAGNGMLISGATGNQTVLANEIDPNRRARLRETLGVEATGLDAASDEYHAQLMRQRPDRVIINPPFGAVFKDGKKVEFAIRNPVSEGVETTPSVDLAIAFNTLDAMTDDGKAVLILGAKTGSQGAAWGSDENRAKSYKRHEYLELFSKYNVTDFFTVDGSLYEGMGAGWPVDVVVIDGKRPTPATADGGFPRPWMRPPQIFKSWDDLAPKLNETNPNPRPGGSGGGTVAPSGEQPGPTASPQPQLAGTAGNPRNPGGGQQPTGVGKPPAEQPGGEQPAPTGTGTVEPKPPVGGVNQPEPVEKPGDGTPAPASSRPAAPVTGVLGALSAEKQARAEELKKRLREKLLQQVGSGADPEILIIGAELAGLYVEGGVRKFLDFARQVRTDMPDIWDKLKNSLLPIWQETANAYPDLDDLTRAQASGAIIQVEQEAAEAQDFKSEPGTPAPETVEEPQPIKEGEESFTASYVQRSKAPDVGLVTPINLADDESKALRQLEEEIGKTVDDFVAEKLQIPKEVLFSALSGPQIDSVALAIRNIERGSALINSDQTGVGKGRTAAAIIRYARLRGLVPVFITAKDTLYSDMLGRDLVEIGETQVNPLVTNSKVAYQGPRGEIIQVKRTPAQKDAILNDVGDTGALPRGYNAIFTTYDQLNASNQRGWTESPREKASRKSNRIPKPPGPAIRALQAVAPNAIFVMDEALLAAGPGSDLNMAMETIIPAAQGVYFLSATYAKRPDNLALYGLRTSMKDAGLTPRQLTDALQSGGMALQQALTSMLATAGEFVRRETKVDGLTFEFTTATADRERERELADTYVEFIRDLMGFNKRIRRMAQEMGSAENQMTVSEERVSISATNFGSLLFNISKQYLLAMRADAVGDFAVQSIRNGEKPFIVVENTMEGVIDSLKDGGYQVSFRGVLKRQLDKMLEFTRKVGQKKEKFRIPPEKLPAHLQAMYYDIADRIEGADLGDMPISPIDRIKQIVRDAGFSIGEITGRSSEYQEEEGGPKPRRGAGAGSTGEARRRELEAYNTGKIDAIIANKAGSTGVSAHAQPKYKDTPGHKRRRMVIAQPLGDINDFIQMIGRVNRFGQLIVPAYTILQSSLAGENRFMVMLRRKLASLNAATSADTDSEFTQTEGLPDDIFNVVGDDVVSKVMQSHKESAEKADIDLDFDPETDANPGDYARTATGKFILLPDEEQRRLWDEIGDLYKATIKALDAAGENPLKASVEDIRARTVRKAEWTEGTGNNPFNGPSVIEDTSIKPPTKPPTYNEALEKALANRPEVLRKVKDWVRQSEDAEERRVQTMQEKEMSPESIENTRRVFSEVRARVEEAAGLIGNSFIDAQGFVGIPTDIDLVAKGTANFTRASDHQLVVIKNKLRSRTPLSLSSIEPTEKGALGKLGMWVTEDPSTVWELSREDAAQRFIVTGNLLRGFKVAKDSTQVRPNISVFTTANGSRRTGIIMPSSFKPDVPKRGLEVGNEVQALNLVQGGTRIYATEPDSDRNQVIIKPEGSSAMVSIRGTGNMRPVWSDSGVLEITGTMTQSGSFLTTQDRPVPMSSIPRLLARLKTLGVGPWKYDAVEKALNWAVEKTTPEAGTYDALQAIPMIVLNQALRAARAVYLATRDYVKARRAAMDYIEANTPEGTDLSGVPAAMDSLLDGGISAGRVQPPNEGTGVNRVKSRGRFAGEVTKDTEKEWTEAASEWIGQFGGDLDRAFRIAIGASAESEYGVDPAIRQVILGQILELSEQRVTFSRNDVALMRNLRFQQEVADALRQSGAQDFGKTGRARQLAFKEMDYLMPVLTHRRLIRDRQLELPIDDTLTDQIRLWMLDVTQRAVANLKDNLASADNLVQRELRRVARESGVNWYELMTSSLSKQGAMRRNLFDRIAEHPVLKRLDAKSRLVLTNLVADAFEKERARIIRAEFAKEVPLPNVRKDTRTKLHTAIPQLVKWANLGILTNPTAAAEAFRNAIAPRFGVATFDGKSAQKIVELSQRAQAVGGVNRNRIIQEMYEVMKADGGIRWRDAVIDFWYNSVLSGLRTQLDQVTSIINGAASATLAGVRHWGAAPYMASAFWDGLRMGGADFLPIVLQGERFRSINFNPELPTSALEALRRSDNLALRAIAQISYVSRIQDAIDHIGSIATQEAMTAWNLYRGYTVEEMREFMTPTAADIALAREKAEIEKTPPNLMNRRVREILAQRIPTDVVLDSREIALEVSSKQTPKGVGGLLYQAIQTVLGKYPEIKMTTGLAFARFAINFTNAQLNYTPIAAAWRWWASGPGISTRHAYPLTEGQRELLVMQGAAGTTAAALVAAVFLGGDDDDRDRKVDITGSFKGIDPKKRAQLLGEGRQPYSFRVGSKYISYRQIPGAMALAAIGELRDRQLYEPDKWNEESLLRKTADGVMAGMFIVKDSPAVSALMETFGFANAYKYDMDAVIERDAPKFFAKLAGSFIPNIIKEIDAWSDPAIYKANTGGEYFVQQVPFWRREVGSGPMLNVLGEPVSVERLPWSRWVRERKEDKAWSTLGQLANRGVFMPQPAASMTVTVNGERKKATAEQLARYQRETGKLYRTFIEGNSEALLAADPETASKIIDRATKRLRARARQIAKMDPDE